MFAFICDRGWGATMDKKLHLNFGLLGGTLKDQLEKQNLSLDKTELDKYEIYRKGIHTLTFNEIISHSASNKAFERLFRKILKSLNEK